MPTCGRGMATLLGTGNCESAMESMTESIRIHWCQSPAEMYCRTMGESNPSWVKWCRKQSQKSIGQT